MLSNGEIYHLAFSIREGFMKKGVQVPVVELRDYLKELNAKDMPKPEMEEKGREWVIQKTKK